MMARAREKIISTRRDLGKRRILLETAISESLNYPYPYPDQKCRWGRSRMKRKSSCGYCKSSARSNVTHVSRRCFRLPCGEKEAKLEASERRCEELVTQVPESTRPLLRQIEAMQETTARRAEAWAGVERSLNSRFQAKAAAAEENERAMNERLSQTISRMAVLEAQISCLRAEQTQLSRSLEKESKRASENRQEYLAAQESVATYEVRVNQLEEEIKEHKKKHRQELMDLMSDKELLQQELEREKTDLERKSRLQSSVPDQSPTDKNINAYLENGGNSMRKLSSAGSLGSMEDSFFLQASLDSSDSFSEKRLKDGELASYMSRLT
ncbi:hypothetical protein MKW98_017717 [Papaver atlanticum]|uniref:Uncharacterized protein n=1 Tax=Papaver atlanticum TaxID=357466 RepID=A0AAD4TBS1_9MAGN|nr:hypothetical protein MKW98_017717 [Papaver atlanticum]